MICKLIKMRKASITSFLFYPWIRICNIGVGWFFLSLSLSLSLSHSLPPSPGSSLLSERKIKNALAFKNFSELPWTCSVAWNQWPYRKILTLAVCSPLLRLKEMPDWLCLVPPWSRVEFSFSCLHPHLRHFYTQAGVKKSKTAAKWVEHRQSITGRVCTDWLLSVESLSDDTVLSTSYLLARSFLLVLSAFFPQPQSY